MASTAVAQTPPDECQAVLLESSGALSFVNENGSAAAVQPLSSRVNVSMASLSPDRQRLLTIDEAAPNSAAISSATIPSILMPIPPGLVGDYPVRGIRWESNDIIRVTRGRNEKEHQFFAVDGWPATPSLRSVSASGIGSDCILNGARVICSSKYTIEQDSVPILSPTTRPQQSMVSISSGQTVAANQMGPTAYLSSNPAISVSVIAIDAAAGWVRAKFTNPEFGFIEAYLRVNEFSEMTIGDFDYQLTLVSFTPTTASFRVSWVPASNGFLQYQHLIVLGKADAGWLLYSRQDNKGTERIGVAALLNTSPMPSYITNTGADYVLPRTRSALQIRGDRNGKYLLIDDTDGSYRVPVTMLTSKRDGAMVSGGTPYSLPSQIAGHPKAKVLEWNCR